MMVLKPELTTPRGLADDMLMLDRCYYIKSLCRLKTLENFVASKISIFYYYNMYNGAQKHAWKSLRL